MVTERKRHEQRVDSRNRKTSAAVLLTMLLVACGPSASTSETVGPTTTLPTTTLPTATTAPPSTVPAGTTSENVWVGPAADITRLPIGTSRVSLTEASIGGLLACDAGNPNGGGAHAVGPWMDEAAGTWDLSQKVSVQGEVSWPMASYSESIEGDSRVITSNGLPVGSVTGEFPIAADDPAYAFDRNRNSIAGHDVTVSLPLAPVLGATPTCLGKGSIGILANGVELFAPLDERNRDAVVYETQDQCDGHPQQTSVYHYHAIPSCIRDAATGASTVVGFALDGFPIVVERDAQGNLPTNADLDRCHGRTSAITLDGTTIERYHYSVTYEFPYFIGCFAGTPVT